MEVEDDEIDEIELGFVLDGYRLKLTGKTRIEAIRQLYAKGVETKEIKHRLYVSDNTIYRLAKQNGIDIPRPLKGHWTEYYFKRSVRKELKERYMK